MYGICRIELWVWRTVRPVLSPPHSDVTLNNEPCPMQKALIEDLQVGAPITARVKFTNNSGLVMPPSLLILEPYQFSQEQKRIIKDLTGKLVYTGNLVARVPEVRVDR